MLDDVNVKVDAEKNEGSNSEIICSEVQIAKANIFLHRASIFKISCIDGSFIKLDQPFKHFDINLFTYIDGLESE